MGGAALSLCVETIREKARRIAGHLLEASETDILFEEGKLFPKGVPAKALEFQEIVDAAYVASALPPEIEPGLSATHFFDPPNFTFPFGAHLAIVVIDKETGEVNIERYVAVYDDNGQLSTGSLMDYAVPKAAWIPTFELGHTETLTPVNPLGAKGVGEAGTIASSAAVINAVVDALSPFDVAHLDMPASPQNVWRAIKGGL